MEIICRTDCNQNHYCLFTIRDCAARMSQMKTIIQRVGVARGGGTQKNLVKKTNVFYKEGDMKTLHIKKESDKYHDSIHTP